MNEEMTELCLRKTEHIRGHLWYRYSATVNQVVEATVKLSSLPPVFGGVRVARSLVFCLVFCRSLFVLFLWAIVLSLSFFDCTTVLSHHIYSWKSVSPVLSDHICSLKSLSSVLSHHIYSLKSVSTVLSDHIYSLKTVSPVLSHHIYSLKLVSSVLSKNTLTSNCRRDEIKLETLISICRCDEIKLGTLPSICRCKRWEDSIHRQSLRVVKDA
jgi:hypothetical protein